MNTKSIKKFVGVKFTKYGELNDVIPKTWLLEENKKARWPSRTSNMEDLVKNCVTPKNSWKIYDIDILCHGSKYKLHH